MAGARSDRRPEHFSLRIRVEGPLRRAQVDRLLAETFEAGVLGYEECEDEGALALTLVVYADAESRQAVRDAVGRAADATVAVGRFEAVAAVDWELAWRAEQRAVTVAERLVIRPESVAWDPVPGVHELVIDPGQAFGTGSHASTRLALTALLGESASLGRDVRVLDVGTGTGILALAALRLGAGWALGIDTDFRASREASKWARRNGLSERFATCAGSPDCLGEGRFELVLANLLRVEILPLVEALASRLGPGGRLVVSGLLSSERMEVASAFAARGLRVRAECVERDEAQDEWLALVMAPA